MKIITLLSFLYITTLHAASCSLVEVPGNYINSAWAVAHSKYNDNVVTRSDKCTLAILNIARGHKTFSTKADINTIVCSPNRPIFIAGLEDGNAEIRSLISGKCLRTLVGHTKQVMAADFSPKGITAATSSEDTTIRIWNTITGECSRTLEDHEDAILYIAYNSKGLQLASASGDCTVRLWRTRTGDCSHVLRGHEGCVQKVIYSPDDKTVASSSDDCSIRIWNTTTGECLQLFRSMALVQDFFYTLCYSPDAKSIAAGTDGGVISTWNIKNGKMDTLVHTRSPIAALIYDSTGKTLVSSSTNSTVRLLDCTTGQVKQELKTTTVAPFLTFNKDNSTLIAASLRTIHLWPTSGLQLTQPSTSRSKRDRNKSTDKHSRKHASSKRSCSAKR